MEREARSEREPQARQAMQEREDRSKHCKRRRTRSTKKNKNRQERDIRSSETASPGIRVEPRGGAARRRLGALSWGRFVSENAESHVACGLAASLRASRPYRGKVLEEDVGRKKKRTQAKENEEEEERRKRSQRPPNMRPKLLRQVSQKASEISNRPPNCAAGQFLSLIHI